MGRILDHSNVDIHLKPKHDHFNFTYKNFVILPIRYIYYQGLDQGY